MKNSGINLNLGLPLDKVDFDSLYVDLYPESIIRLTDWWRNLESEPLMVAGQIGVGKTTFINKLFYDQTCTNPDICLSLTECPSNTEEGFWGCLFGKTLQFALSMEIDLKPYDLIDELNKAPQNLTELIDQLINIQISIKGKEGQKGLFTIVRKHLDLQTVQSQIESLLDECQKRLNRKLFVYVEGTDKFKPEKPEYESLLGLLNFLVKYKTLYEANLIHIIGIQEWQKIEKLVLTCVTQASITNILNKRLGIYKKFKQEVIPELARLSGGHPRQAVRLLNDYEYAYERLKKSRSESIDYACQRVRIDFLQISSSPIYIPVELLKVVEKEQVYVPNRQYDFNEIYLNWLLVIAEPEEKWPVILNPVLPSLNSFPESTPESPEVLVLREWAKNNEISPSGLEINDLMFIKGLSFEFPGLNINEAFDALASLFLNDSRREKVIIVYENQELAAIANDYFIGRTGSYKPVIFKDIKVKTEEELISKLRGNASSCDGYSVFFENEISMDDIRKIDERRDLFLDYPMIWWINKININKYLSEWSHIRQFFKVIRLEENILEMISIKEIEGDISDLDLIDFSENKEAVKNRLDNVLNYLKGKVENV